MTARDRAFAPSNAPSDPPSNAPSIVEPRWGRAIAEPAVEFGPEPLPVLEGAVPSELRGTLYRNGPARLERGGQRAGHWFDGDGAVLAVRFDGSAPAIGTYRYLQTAGYRAEAAADRLLFGGYGTLAPVPWWQRLGRDLKNAANTSVVAVGDGAAAASGNGSLPDNRLLALWEGGLPHALDPDTLETFGTDDLAGKDLAGKDLAGKELAGEAKARQTGGAPAQERRPSLVRNGKTIPYSAHPKRDPRTGCLFNFGVVPGPRSQLCLHRSDRAGRLEKQGAIALDGLPLIHDFVLAGRYLVFCVAPVRLNLLPAFLNLASFSDSLVWKPQLGTQIWVVDADSLEPVCRLEADPWYQWHFGNGWTEPDGEIAFHLVRYADFATNQYLKEVASGRTETDAPSEFWEIRLDPRQGKLRSQVPVLAEPCEFPVVAPHRLGQPHRHTYLSVHRPDLPARDRRRELFGAIAALDGKTGAIARAALPAGCYPSEPIVVPHPDDAPDEGDQRGWVLTAVYDGNRHASELWIYDCDGLEAGPRCCLGLPSFVPPSFHGTWRSAR